MFLNETELNVSFRLWHEGKSYASTGSMKCFECGDIGNKKVAYPHKVQNSENTQQCVDDVDRDNSSNVGEVQPQAVSEIRDSSVAVDDNVRPIVMSLWLL